MYHKCAHPLIQCQQIQSRIEKAEIRYRLNHSRQLHDILLSNDRTLGISLPITQSSEMVQYEAFIYH